MPTVREYERAKEQAAKLQKDAAKAEALYEQAMEDLAALGCGSLAEAKAMLAEHEQELIDATTAYDTAKQDFEEAWGDALGSDTEED